MNISKERLISAVKYVRSYARRIDRLDLTCYCGRGERSELIEALSAYQNDDGGFGQAIEPDFRVPDSSVTATTIAFNYLIEHNASSESEIVRKGIEYLVSTYLLENSSWPPVCKEIIKYLVPTGGNIILQSSTDQMSLIGEIRTCKSLVYLIIIRT